MASLPPTGDDLVLVPHSNGGLFVPVLAEAVDHHTVVDPVAVADAIVALSAGWSDGKP